MQGQVDPLEDLLPGDLDVQVLYDEAVRGGRGVAHGTLEGLRADIVI